MAERCVGSIAVTLRMRRSSVPCTRSVGLLMPASAVAYRWETSKTPVGKQGEHGQGAARRFTGTDHEASQRRLSKSQAATSMLKGPTRTARNAWEEWRGAPGLNTGWPRHR